MGHHVQVFVGPREILGAIVARFGRSKAVDLAHGNIALALLPLTGELYDAIEWAPGEAFGSEPPFVHLTAKVKRVLAAASDERPLAYLETDYAGGHGTQGAVVAHNQRIVFGPTSGPDTINSALKLLGVRASAGGDEFDAIGLGNCRSNEDWLEAG